MVCLLVGSYSTLVCFRVVIYFSIQQVLTINPGILKRGGV